MYTHPKILAPFYLNYPDLCKYRYEFTNYDNYDNIMNLHAQNKQNLKSFHDI